jgi:hypothetical protein
MALASTAINTKTNDKRDPRKKEPRFTVTSCLILREDIALDKMVARTRFTDIVLNVFVMASTIALPPAAKPHFTKSILGKQ